MTIKSPSCILLLFSALILAANMHAQEEQPELVTDRPDQTESSVVVPAGSLQVETGFILESDETVQYRQKSTVYNTSLFRYGLLKNFELRAGMAYLENRLEIKNSDTITTISGLSPLYAGFKVYITDESGWIPQTSFIGGLILPFTAVEGFKPAYSGIAMRFACAHTLSERISLGYNLGVELNGSSIVPGYFYSVALGFSVTDKLGAYAESYGLMPEKGGAAHLVDGGITYLLMPTLQLDLSGGFGINEQAPDNYFSLGMSLRLPR